MNERRWSLARLEKIGPLGLASDPAYWRRWARDPRYGRRWRSIRHHFGITGFGVNANEAAAGEELVVPHDEVEFGGQEELYLVHRGTIEFRFGEGDEEQYHELGPGGLARVDAPTVRSLRNTSESDDAVYLCVGGEGGYVGRDGQVP